MRQNERMHVMQYFFEALLDFFSISYSIKLMKIFELQLYFFRVAYLHIFEVL